MGLRRIEYIVTRMMFGTIDADTVREILAGKRDDEVLAFHGH